jgi:hypothetical protein
MEDIRRHFEKFGNILATINHNEQFKPKYKNFAECCVTEFGLSGAHAYRFIAGAKVHNRLEKHGFAELPMHESHVRLIAQLEAPEDEPKVWSKVLAVAKEKSKRPTAQIVKDVIKELCPDHAKPAKNRGKNSQSTTTDSTPAPGSASLQLAKPMATHSQAAEQIVIDHQDVRNDAKSYEQFGDSINQMCMGINAAIGSNDLDAAREIVRRIADSAGDFYRKVRIIEE